MEKDEDKYLLFNDNEDHSSTDKLEKKFDIQNNNDFKPKSPTDTLISFNKLYSSYKIIKVMFFFIFLHPIFNHILNKKVIKSMFTNEEYTRVNKYGLYLLVFILFLIQFLTPNKSTTMILSLITILFILMHLSNNLNLKDLDIINIKSIIKEMPNNN